MWTKQELKKVLEMWETKTTESIAAEFKVSKATIQQMATKFRKLGAKLAKKHRVGYLDNLMKEVIKESK